MHPASKRKLDDKLVAKEHIDALFARAEEVFSSRPDLSHRYVAIARSIQTRHKVRLTPFQKRSFCKHCLSYLRSGTNARVRLREGRLTVLCHACKHITRTPFKGKRAPKGTSPTRRSRRTTSPRRNGA
jgi:ribonuclease P protein subunit RPR2